MFCWITLFFQCCGEILVSGVSAKSLHSFAERLKVCELSAKGRETGGAWKVLKSNICTVTSNMGTVPSSRKVCKEVGGSTKYQKYLQGVGEKWNQLQCTNCQVLPKYQVPSNILSPPSPKHSVFSKHFKLKYSEKIWDELVQWTSWTKYFLGQTLQKLSKVWIF